MPWSKPIARRSALASAPHVHVPARGGPWSRTAQSDLLASIGDHGGLLSWKSSPHVMWLAERLTLEAGK
jgi:hypothetical protein